MQVQTVNDGIFTIKNFLSSEECQHWIDFSEEQGFEAATVQLGQQTVSMPQVRNNYRFIHDDHDLAQQLWDRLPQAAQPPIETGYPIGLNERFRFYKYYAGQQFRRHKDGSFIRHIHEWSAYTFMVYLNDAEEVLGGETRFDNDIISPRQGMALIFKHELPHEGSMVLQGVKYVLRSDMMYRRKGK